MAHEATIIPSALLVTTLTFTVVVGALLIYAPKFYIHVRQS